MRRRTLLHAAGTAGLAALAGCSALQSPTELHSPERTDEPGETYWTFHRNDERLTTVGLEYSEPHESGLVPLRFHTWHREDTHLESFRLELRFGRRAGQVPPEVYLDTFDSSPDPSMNYLDDPDRGGTILEVPDLGSVGVGSLTVEFLVQPHGWLPDELGVGIEQTLSTDGALESDYRTVLDDRMPLDIETA